MKKAHVTAWLVVVALIASARFSMAQGQGLQGGRVLVPDTSVEQAKDIGQRAHTNHVILLRGAGPGITPSGLSPATIRAVYGLPSSSTSGSGVIAIVDAYDYPTAQSDFDKFATQYGLPLSTQNLCNGANPCFKSVYASGKKPKANCGWAQEAALDIEWAHAMAPYAQIVLVEAASNSFADLLQAVDVASNEVLCGNTKCSSGGSGIGEVSMSWGGSEFSSEASNDSHFTTPGVVYFAASGDTGGQTIYPSASPNVVAAGGTTLHFDGAGNFTGETGWSGSGGGPSKYEPRPAYQDVISALVGAKRGLPDFSFDADPNSGVSVYDSTSCQGMSGWMVFGGTSVASPSLAGIVNLASHFYTSSNNELSVIYADYASPTYSTDFRDITSGTAGKFTAGARWDFVTGVGSDLGLVGK
jgi:kumamolisin